MMDENKKPKRRVNYVWPLAGIYLIYLAYRMVRDVVDGVTAYPVVSIAGALVFAAVGGYLLWREWKSYQYDLAHKDDPSTWSDDPTVWAGADDELPETEDGLADEPEDGEDEEDEP